MRRCVAGALLLLLVGQSSGLALAATPVASGRPVDVFGALFEPVRAAIARSTVYATLTGTPDRDAAAHTLPAIVRTTSDLDPVGIMHREVVLRPRIRQGVPHPVTMPPLTELEPRHHLLDPLAMRRSTITPKTSLSAPGPGTGVEHWWTYEERAIPGIGKAMVNVGTGNYLVSAMDVDVPERGIDLTFQRVYNSQSLHDANGEDGANPSIFGNRWTNNLDAGIVYDPAAVTMTVYDLNGTACTYTSKGDGLWQPCAGQYATLSPTDSTDCSYEWQKKNGTVYWFHADVSGSGCSIAQAKQGRLKQILARNDNNKITFSYSYNGQGESTEDITEIDAVHSDGHELKLLFGLIAGTSINELAEIVRPDGAILQYAYDSSGNLVEVDKPGNNSASSVPSGHGVPRGNVPETYAYTAGTSTLQEACGPRCTVAMWNNPSKPTDGAAMLFTADGSARLTSWQINGVLNFKPDDQTSPETVLQPGLPTSFQQWYLANFVYGNGPACSRANAGTTTMCDTDGHATVWVTNENGSVAKTKESAGPGEGIMVVSEATWDANNNLIATTDANGYVTKYAYDQPGHSQGGNLVQMQLPEVSDIGGGSLSPLSTYSYDSYNNVTAYCDPVFNQTHDNRWVDNPGDGLCPNAKGAARFTFNAGTPDPNEPYGCLTAIKKPGGYDTAISYPSKPGSCGNGLPTQTLGDSITQYNDATRQPTQNFSYDGYGNLIGYDKGQDTTGKYQGSWTLGYDAMNRLDEKTENDKQIPLTGSSFSCYYPDGSLLYTETPSQHDFDGGSCPSTETLLQGNYTPPKHATAYYYDLDGDQVKVVTHKGCSPNNACPGASSRTACATGETNPIGTTCKYYDGLDRLVETIEPYDSGRGFGSVPYEFYAFRWMNRYIYDLSQQGGQASLQIADTTGTIDNLVAFGNLYKTQEYLPQIPGMIAAYSHGQYQKAEWSDVRGTSFDGLDRPIGKYELAYGTKAVTLNTYDCSEQLDLLCSTTNATGQTTNYTYDTNRRVSKIGFSGTTPLADDRKYTFDADGRTASAKNSMGTLSYTYDVDGNQTSVTEPSGEHAASLICYDYYPDGLREYLSIGMTSDSCGNIPQRQNPSNGGISQTNIFSYSYRLDGLLKTQLVSWLGNSEPFSWTYTPSERELTETDPLSGQYGFVAKTYTYDSYGRVKSLTLPGGGFAQSALVYDVDDELAGYTASSSSTTVNRQFTLNARGEMIEDAVSNVPLLGTFYGQAATLSANGTQVGNGNCMCPGGTYSAPPTTLEYDVRSGMATCSPNVQWPNFTSNEVYQYDAAGRQSGAGQSSTGSCGGSPESSASYDSENHILQTTVSWQLNSDPVSGCGTANVTWGPDARQRSDLLSGCSYGDETQSAHWDGATLLFATYGQQGSNVPILYIGKLAVMGQDGRITMSDRDQTGAQASTHGFASTKAFYTAWSLGSPRTAYVAKNGSLITFHLFAGTCGGSGQTICPGVPVVYGMLRSDGYAMVGGLVQGARTYDPTSGQWLTPDPFAGDVRDLMSQKPFIWNGNNPVEFQDPSGYDPLSAFQQFLTTMWQRLANLHFPGYPPSGNKSGGLSNENMRRLGSDFERGNTGHLQKLQDALRSLRTMYNESYEAQTSPREGEGARNTLRSEYDQAVTSAQKSGFSDDQLFNTGQGTLPSSLPTEQQSNFYRSLGEPASGGVAPAEGEETPIDVDMPPTNHDTKRT